MQLCSGNAIEVGSGLSREFVVGSQFSLISTIRTPQAGNFPSAEIPVGYSSQAAINFEIKWEENILVL